MLPCVKIVALLLTFLAMKTLPVLSNLAKTLKNLLSISVFNISSGTIEYNKIYFHWALYSGFVMPNLHHLRIRKHFLDILDLLGNFLKAYDTIGIKQICALISKSSIHRYRTFFINFFFLYFTN